MASKSLKIAQLEKKMKLFQSLQKVQPPASGWIKTLRTTLGMTLQQLGSKLRMTKQSALDLENREREGAVSLKTLRDVAEAMDMQLVYGFVPKDGSLDALIERKARAMATTITMRTSATMKLEDQEITQQRLKKAIDERTIELKNKLPKNVWD